MLTRGVARVVALQPRTLLSDWIMGCHHNAEEHSADLRHESVAVRCVGQKVVEAAGQFVGANREIEHTALRQRVSSHCHMLCRVARWLQWCGHRNYIRLRRPLYMR